MLNSLRLENFTVFADATFEFGRNLNVVVGENASGKSHVLKAAYAAIAASAAAKPRNGAKEPIGKESLQIAIADKLQGVYRPEGIWRLVSRRPGNASCTLTYKFDPPALDLTISLSRRAGAKVQIVRMPTEKAEKRPVFLPTRELLSIAPGFVAVYETTQLQFEETWYDTVILLEAPLARGPRERHIRELLQPLEELMGGTVDVGANGGFSLKLGTGRMEMHLVAEGLRKIAMLARLVATGSLLDKGYLFWDEPESNLNPKAIRTVARAILQIAASGIQVFVASHSLFLLRELHILQLQEYKSLDTKCFGLHSDTAGLASVMQGRTMDDIGDISVLNEDLQQSERYIDTEMGLPIGTPDAE